MHRYVLAILLAALICAPPSVSVADDDGTLNVYWKEGLRLDGADGVFKLKIGGRIQNDWAVFDDGKDVEAATGDIDDGTEFRRARLYVAGVIYEHVIFKAQYDFAGGDADFKDVYIGLQDLAWIGTIRAGHMFEPFSLEQLTSSKYITFLERGLPIALAFDRNTGIVINNTAFDERMTWAAGVFRDSDSFGDSVGSEYNFSGRITGLPLFMADDQLIHVGAGYRHSNPVDDELRLTSRPEAHIAPNFVDTRDLIPDPANPGEFLASDIAADDTESVGGELAAVFGPLSLQGEYIHTFVDAAGGDVDLSGWYAFASLWLTGEHRVYDKGEGVFSRVKPHQNFNARGGPGAWEIALRYSTLDFDDGSVTGGELDDITVGLNWHLNPNTRVQMNYVRAYLDDRDGLVGEESVNIYQWRFQVDF